MEKLNESATEREEGWRKLTNEQVMLHIFKINLFISKIVAEIEVKLELLTVKSSAHDWCNLVSRLRRELGKLIDCFPPYSSVNYNSSEERQTKYILEDFKEFNKRKNYQEEYFKLRAQILVSEKFLVENAPSKRENEELKNQVHHLRSQIDFYQSRIKELKTSIRCVTSEIVREKKAVQREESLMETQKANAIQRLEELRLTLRKKEELLKETAEQRQSDKCALQNEKKENERLVRTLNFHIEEQRVLKDKVGKGVKGIM